MKNTSSQQKILFIVMDGWGLYKPYPGNAVELAHKPFYDKLWKECPSAVLKADGESVGLPEGQMGTSEVNHFTIGAGKVEFQDLVRINHAIDDGTFYDMPAFIESCSNVKKNNSTLHLVGIASEGGVHGHENHLIALVEMAKKHGVQDVALHLITDGRDTEPRSGKGSVFHIERSLQEIGLGRIVSIVGRYFAMDRDHNWERTDKSFLLMTKGKGENFTTAEKALEASYQKNITDEFIEPSVIGGEANFSAVGENDSLIFVNFRSDRPRQLTERFLEKGPHSLHFTTMTRYSPHYATHIAFAPEPIPVSVGQIISEAGIKQLRTTETEKSAHMTFFINCRREVAFEGEDRLVFDSYSDIKTHDERPEMRCPDIAKAIIADIESGTHPVIFTNLCNPDMVGHSANIPATIKACETVNQALEDIIPVAQKHGFHVIVTADHGNADMLLDEETGALITSHTLNPVPFILVSEKYKKLNRNSGTLIDIAPTILTILGLPIAESMTGKSFI